MNYRIFYASGVVTVIGLIAAYFWGGTRGLFITARLAILEVSLSFDNAVVNAKILKRMSPLWQKRFLTWGILVAVFGTRVLLPILIVSASVAMSPILVTMLALNDPDAYAKAMKVVSGILGAFPGIHRFLRVVRE